MKIAYRAANIIEAHIVAGMLNAYGIETHVGGHYLQGAIGDLSPTGFANVFVNEQDSERAADLVLEYDQRGSQQASPADEPAAPKPAV